MIDDRLTKIEQERKSSLNQSNDLYNGLLKDNQDNYDMKNQLLNDYERTQNDILDKQLKFNQDEIDKQKKIALENKETEERKARNDYMNYIDPYGYQNENLIQNGLLNSGVYTKENLGAFTTYQNRLSSANKVLQDAYNQYDSEMNQARLNNDVQKAQNALAKLQQQITFADSLYTNKQNLLLNQFDTNLNIDNNYYNRYQTEYSNIQNEKAAAEATRQWEAEMKFKRDQAAQDQRNWEKEYALSQAASNSKYGNSSSSSSNGLLDGETLQDATDTTYYNKYLEKNISYNADALTNGKIDYQKVFSNGYQPNNVNGNKLKSTGLKVSQYLGTTGSVGSTGVNIDNQNVWAANNKFYVWDGSQNKYIDITKYGKPKGAGGSGGIR